VVTNRFAIKGICHHRGVVTLGETKTRMSIPSNFHEMLTSEGQLYSVFDRLLPNFNSAMDQIIYELPASGLGVIAVVGIKAFGIIHPVVNDAEGIRIAVLQLITNDPVMGMLG